MNNIEVGEYIRTKNGFIDEVIIEYNGKCNNPKCNYKHISCKNNYYNEDNIINHSKNIIDLIEVGDYVNGERVIDTWNGNRIETHRSNFHEDNINSIVTKQQFQAIEYKIGG